MRAGSPRSEGDVIANTSGTQVTPIKLADAGDYEAAMQAWQREQVLAEVKPGELDAYRAWRAAQAQAQAQAHAPSQQPAKLPRSLATASGNGAAGSPHIPVGPGEAFASVIPR